ncbi:hypothetical protein LJR289_000625 [Pseudoduganella sp. LjRoot289]|uniref:hypothetical protein n=1 Tax=Pseudoduganella sp. LjRoot289 TaxID=3342314 RepID=UPI003ECF9345
MKKSISLTIFPLLLAGCAGLGGPPPAVGEPMGAVQTKLGRPSATYKAGSDTLLEYATGPYGQTTWMARFGPDGALKSYEQVLADDKFATLKVGQATRDDVLHTVGHPVEQSYLALRDLTVWSYRYKQSGVWDSMMHVHFDRAGVVREMMAGPDPDREERRGFFR